MKTITTTYLEVRHTKGTFGRISTIGKGLHTRPIQTLEEAMQVINDFCTHISPNATISNIKYWADQKQYLEVFRVVKKETKIDIN